MNVFTFFKSRATSIYLSTLILYLLQIALKYYSLPYALTAYLLGGLAIFFLVFSVPQLRGTVRFLVFFMLVAGSLMFVASGKGLPDFLLGLQDMVNLLCILMVIELAGFPISMMDLKPLFRPLVDSTRNPIFFYWILSLCAMVLGAVINLAIVPIIYYAVWDTLQEKGLHDPRAMGNSIKRGVALALFWTPLGIMMAITLEYSGVLWLEMVPVLFPLTALALVISLFSDFLQAKKEGKRVGPARDRTQVPGLGSFFWATFFPLAFYVLVLMACVLFLNTIAGLGMIDTLIITAVSIPFAWSFLRGERKQVAKRTRDHFQQKVPRLGQPFSLFLAAGIFAQGLRSFGFEALVDHVLLFLLDYLGAVGIVMVIVFTIVMLSWVGVHQMVSLVIIGQNINFDSGIMPPLFYAMAMMLGGSFANLTSPISAITLIISSYFNRSPFEVGLRWNAIFVALFLISVPFFLLLFLTV